LKRSQRNRKVFLLVVFLLVVVMSASTVHGRACPLGAPEKEKGPGGTILPGLSGLDVTPTELVGDERDATAAGEHPGLATTTDRGARDVHRAFFLPSPRASVNTTS